MHRHKPTPMLDHNNKQQTMDRLKWVEKHSNLLNAWTTKELECTELNGVDTAKTKKNSSVNRSHISTIQTVTQTDKRVSMREWEDSQHGSMLKEMHIQEHNNLPPSHKFQDVNLQGRTVIHTYTIEKALRNSIRRAFFIIIVFLSYALCSL